MKFPNKKVVGIEKIATIDGHIKGSGYNPFQTGHGAWKNKKHPDRNGKFAQELNNSIKKYID